MFDTLRKTLSVAGALCVSACGAASAPLGPTTFPATPFLVVPSQSGALTVRVFSAPSQPPQRGLNSFQFEVTTTAGAMPVSGLQLEVVPFMPQMNHGTPTTPTVDAGAPGLYEVDDVDLFMPGEFELRTSVTGPQSDSVSPTFSVD